MKLTARQRRALASVQQSGAQCCHRAPLALALLNYTLPRAPLPPSHPARNPRVPAWKSASRCARARCNSTRAARAIATAAARSSVARAQARALAVKPVPVPTIPRAGIDRLAAGRTTRLPLRVLPSDTTHAAPLGTRNRRATGAPISTRPAPAALARCTLIAAIANATARRRDASNR